MPVISESVLARHHDEGLAPTARVRPAGPDRAAREAAASELRRAFCAQLKAARERRGISLRAIAEATKVSEALFADLERCKVSRWPTGIYRRAFFREYAALIGMPGESTVSEFLRLFPEEMDQAAPADEFVPGPLRLTIATPFWRQVSMLHLLAAAVDLAIVGAATVALAWLTGGQLWAVLAAMTLAYYTTGTATLGCSFGTWWIRNRGHRTHSQGLFLSVLLALAIGVNPAAAQTAQTAEKPFEPTVGQAGKDVVWVPTPEEMVEKMLDLGQVTPRDFVMDLGSGDGRNVIGAAKRGASGLGVEYNPDMVALSKRLAAEAGVESRAQFVQGDMFEADISKADVLALFLLPSNLLRLRSKFLDLRPGSRIVSNTFSIQDWEADETIVLNDCEQWCTAMLYIVPAKVAGTWRVGSDVLELTQEFQKVTGTLTTAGQSVPVTGRLRGTDIALTAGERQFTGRVQGNNIQGTEQTGTAKSNWRATR